ncbi:MAG: hypothetical protein HKN14_09975 [Marinicaulis sp.]|nr:hypothetical protein [Marinicaulis sp.]NNE41230.1 hypothetical protein [Marinicaulis sp.]NNL89853.1 hypothetical protein [Marinicaulis sp.]
MSQEKREKIIAHNDSADANQIDAQAMRGNGAIAREFGPKPVSELIVFTLVKLTLSRFRY